MMRRRVLGVGGSGGVSAEHGGGSVGVGLYVHVPFCERKCPYCAFFSYGGARRELVAAWMAGVAREAELVGKGAKNFRPRTVFFGGGTPTWLRAEELGEVVKILGMRLDLSAVEEWTCEANPGSLTEEKLAILLACGVNRLSIGAQSFDDGTLRLLGRAHDGEAVWGAVAAAKGAGFRHVGIDLIYGVPGAGEGRLGRDLAAAMGCGADHISCYCLEFERGTAFWGKRPRGRGGLARLEEMQWREYREARRALLGGGWRQYELSNFAKGVGAACGHNLLYWSGGEYLGLGPAAHSHWGGARWGNTRRLPVWRRGFWERLSREAAAREVLVMGLRRTAGWDLGAFRGVTGFDVMELRGEEIRRGVGEGMLVLGGGRLRLSARAYFISDAIFSELV